MFYLFMHSQFTLKNNYKFKKHYLYVRYNSFSFNFINMRFFYSKNIYRKELKNLIYILYIENIRSNPKYSQI